MKGENGNFHTRAASKPPAFLLSSMQNQVHMGLSPILLTVEVLVIDIRQALI